MTTHKDRKVRAVRKVKRVGNEPKWFTNMPTYWAVLITPTHGRARKRKRK